MSELDARIRAKLEVASLLESCGDPITELTYPVLVETIEVVLGLHPTIEDGLNPPHCAHCGVRAIEPCPTKRAIAEKLGVEVERG